MTTYVALLRAVNVGGARKLAMTDLKAVCEAAGFARVRTYIASGNVLFETNAGEAAVKRTLETRLHELGGRAIEVMVRTAAEMREVLARNPFPDGPGNRVVAIFLDAPPPSTLENITGQADEQVALGTREIYVWYGDGMGTSKLKIPAAKAGTARNMNTVARLAAMASERA